MLRRNLPLAVLAFCFALLAGCGGGGNTGTPSVTALTLSFNVVGNTLTFAPQVIATSSAATVVSLSNAGNTSITLSSFVIGGANASDFAISNNTCTTNTTNTTFAAGSTCTTGLVFTPSGTGIRTATLTITDTVPGSPQVITLTGTGTAAPAPAVTFSPGPLTFANTLVGSPSATQTIAVTNTGTAALNISGITINGIAASSYSQTNNCPATLAPTTGNCTISVTFTPTTIGTLAAAVLVADNVTGSPQSIALSGTGIAPAATLTGNILTFSSAPTVTSAAQSVTLTNTGTATLNIGTIAIGGTNISDFALTTSTTPCGATLAPAASCIITATFTPTAPTTYAATISIPDNASGSPQSITLNGTGTAATSVYRTLFATPMSDNSITPLYNLINGAQSTIDMTMYEMQDTTFLNDLIARCKAGVKVRVIFSSSVASSSKTSYTALNAQTNCSAVDSNTAFTNTHQKTITVDAATANATTAILSLNLQSQYYSTTRDFGIITNDAADIAAIEDTFTQDYAAAGTNSSADFNYPSLPGDDLVWSPTTATVDMVGIIANAKSTLYIECEEFSAPNIISAIATAASNGVKVVFICENEGGEYNTAFQTIKTAGATVYYYSSNTGFYIHAKAVVADLGLPTEAVYMGSINYSTASLTKNRELGVYITGNTAVSSPIALSIQATIIADETGSGVHTF